jgi:hypothetical protein
MKDNGFSDDDKKWIESHTKHTFIIVGVFASTRCENSFLAHAKGIRKTMNSTRTRQSSSRGSDEISI